MGSKSSKLIIVQPSQIGNKDTNKVIPNKGTAVVELKNRNKVVSVFSVEHRGQDDFKEFSYPSKDTNQVLPNKRTTVVELREMNNVVSVGHRGLDILEYDFKEFPDPSKDTNHVVPNTGTAVIERRDTNKVLSVGHRGHDTLEDDFKEFPDPGSIEVFEYIPPDNSETKSYKMEDIFWEGKRKLIPDYSALMEIDEHALKTPKNLKHNPDDLIQHLLKVAKTELEKVRVLIRWIGDNIAYDIAGRDAGKADCSFEGVLRSGKAICAGYANVVLMFCKKANIECRRISGQTKSGEFRKEIRVIPKLDHAWNQVKIDGAWYLMDSTWSAGSVAGKTFTKRWKEEWFIADPKACIYTHLPMDGKGQISKDFQQITKPFTSSEEWDKLVYRSPFGCAFGFEPINFPEKNLKITDSKLILKYKCSGKLDHYVSIKNKRGTIKLNNEWHMVFENNGIVTANIRFPRPDIYHVDVNAKCKFEGDTDETNARCFQYIVVNTGKAVDPFPGPYGWGEKDDFTNAGFKLMQPISPIIEAENGVAKVKVKLPSEGIIPSMFGFLQYTSGKETKLNRYVYAEKTGTIATYYIQCPEAGEYRFIIYIKINKGEKNYTHAHVLITSKEKKGIIFLMPESNNSSLGGPGPGFYQLGFTTNHTSTIPFDEDKATLYIKKTNGAYLRGTLISAADPNAAEYIKKEEDMMKCVFTVKKPKVPGFYWIKLFGGEDQHGKMVYIGTYCVPYMVPFIQN